MKIYYVINGIKYIDTHNLRETLELNKSELQHLLNRYRFPENETIIIQNKKLYSIRGFSEYIEMVLKENEG